MNSNKSDPQLSYMEWGATWHEVPIAPWCKYYWRKVNSFPLFEATSDFLWSNPGTNLNYFQAQIWRWANMPWVKFWHGLSLPCLSKYSKSSQILFNTLSACYTTSCSVHYVLIFRGSEKKKPTNHSTVSFEIVPSKYILLQFTLKCSAGPVKPSNYKDLSLRKNLSTGVAGHKGALKLKALM